MFKRVLFLLTKSDENPLFESVYEHFSSNQSLAVTRKQPFHLEFVEELGQAEKANLLIELRKWELQWGKGKEFNTVPHRELKRIWIVFDRSLTNCQCDKTTDRVSGLLQWKNDRQITARRRCNDYRRFFGWYTFCKIPLTEKML